MNDDLDQKNAELVRAFSQQAYLLNEYENARLAVDVFGQNSDLERATDIKQLLAINSKQIKELKDEIKKVRRGF